MTREIRGRQGGNNNPVDRSLSLRLCSETIVSEQCGDRSGGSTNDLTMARRLRVLTFVGDTALLFVLVDEAAIVIQTILGEDFAAVGVIIEQGD